MGIRNDLEDMVRSEVNEQVAPGEISLPGADLAADQQFVRRRGRVDRRGKSIDLSVVSGGKAELSLTADPPEGLDGQRRVTKLEDGGPLSGRLHVGTAAALQPIEIHATLVEV